MGRERRIDDSEAPCVRRSSRPLEGFELGVVTEAETLGELDFDPLARQCVEIVAPAQEPIEALLMGCGGAVLFLGLRRSSNVASRRYESSVLVVRVRV